MPRVTFPARNNHFNPGQGRGLLEKGFEMIVPDPQRLLSGPKSGLRVRVLGFRVGTATALHCSVYEKGLGFRVF